MLNNKEKHYLIKYLIYFIIFNVFYNIIGSYAVTDNSLDFDASLLYNKEAIITTSINSKFYHATPNFSEPSNYTEYASFEDFAGSVNIDAIYVNLYSALGIM